MAALLRIARSRFSLLYVNPPNQFRGSELLCHDLSLTSLACQTLLRDTLPGYTWLSSFALLIPGLLTSVCKFPYTVQGFRSTPDTLDFATTESLQNHPCSLRVSHSFLMLNVLYFCLFVPAIFILLRPSRITLHLLCLGQATRSSTMIINTRLVQRAPPLWLFLTLPFLIFICTVIVYQNSIVANIPESVTQKITNGLQSVSDSVPWKAANAKAQIPATIIREGDHDEYLAVCLFVRDQAQDLVEFFQHHYYEMGIRRFYVMDDGSNPPMSHYMDKFGIPEEAVDFIHSEIATSEPQGMQK